MNEPVVIVGAGIAGLSTALAAAPRPVLLISRGTAGEGSATALAQGGIAAAIGPGDSAQAHAIDTLAAGALHNDAARVLWLCTQAAPSVRWLEQLGVAFDRDRSGALRLGREGGHGVARIVHAGGDASGAEIFRVLAARARAAAHITWLGGASLVALRLQGGRACGVRVQTGDGQLQEIPAAAVVLATGGIGALFARSTNPAGADGAGLALALAAGARARDLEFVQFHPTALDGTHGLSLPLITEALRGAGARLRTTQGWLLMERTHAQGDLAPRDVVARRIWRAQQRHERVVLDATALRIDWPSAFPNVLAACLARGIDPRTTPIPVTPAAHFHMGGIAVDADGRSSLPGLFAVGEVACSGVHGANRLASNSLLEGVACGRRLGGLLARPLSALGQGASIWCELGRSLPDERLASLRQRMWDAAGPLRSPKLLRMAAQQMLAWSGEGWQARLAAAVLDAALRRRNSLGAHWHVDTAEIPAMRERVARVG